MNRMIPPHYRPAESMIGSVPRCDLVFHPAAPGATTLDPRTNQVMRIDGYWKTHAGRTIHIALSAPGSILRSPLEISA